MMKERTIIILQALVQEFINTANPVASKKLIEYYDFDISSATIRNEFAILEDVGFISSPHVSAGKVPTQKGYRFFVDEMLENKQEDKKISTLFTKYVEEYKIAKAKENIFDVLKILAQMSNNVAFCVTNEDKTFYLGGSNVLRSPEFLNNPEQAAQVFEILEGRDRFKNLLSKLLITEKVKIFIGEENILEEISSCGMLVCTFKNQSLSGYLGILGPMRMNYSLNKSLINNALELLV